MRKGIKRVAVTGGAGQIAYSLLFRIASGELFGPDQPISLRILELPAVIQALEGVRMELEDCAFPLLQELLIGSEPDVIFRDVDYALLVGAKPRGPGMERGELLAENKKIFEIQGRSLNEVAADGVQVLVVGNPCNTNCLIASRHAPRIPKHCFHAMMRLDQNRAVGMLARKGNVRVNEVSRMTIWGNHSATQVPDASHVLLLGHPAREVINDPQWLERDLIEQVQQRGAAIIAARGKSSAASAAQAAIDEVKSLHIPTPDGQWVSAAIYSQGNPYGIDEDLFFSFPCHAIGEGKFQIVKGLAWSPEIERRIRVTEKELQEERRLIS